MEECENQPLDDTNIGAGEGGRPEINHFSESDSENHDAEEVRVPAVCRVH